MAQSPAIGTYTPQVNAQEALPRRVAPQAPNTSTAPGLQALASGIADVGDAIAKVQAKDAAVRASQMMADLRVTAEQQFQDAQSKAAADATGFTPTVMQGFDKTLDDMTGSRARKGGLFNSDDLAAKLVRQSALQLRSELESSAMRFEAQTRVAYRSASMLDSAKKVAVAVEANPDSWQQAGVEQMTALNALGLPPKERLALASHIDDQISAAAARGYARSDPSAVVNRLNNPNDELFGSMSAEQRASVTQFARGQLVDQHAGGILKAYESSGADAGIHALASIEHDPSIPEDLRDNVRAKANSMVDQLRVQRRQQFTSDIVKLEGDIAGGKATQDDKAAAYALYRNNAFGPEQLASTLANIDRVQAKRADDGLSVQAALTAYQNHTPLDPKNKDASDAVTLLFDGMVKGVAPGSSEFTNRAVDVAARTGIVPSSAISWARSNLVSGSPDDAAKSADLIARLQEDTPQAAGFGVDTKTSAMADTISQAVRAGTPSQVAVDIARRNAQISDAEQKALDTKWAQMKTNVSQPGALKEALKADGGVNPHFWTAMPAVPPAMQGEFNQLTRDYFNYTDGNLQQSRQLAVRDLQRVWGVTEVNGKRELMPYAPESMFPSLSPVVVREDIAKTVAEHADSFQHLNASGQLERVPVKASDVRLIPTDRTARTHGAEWQLGAPDQFGAMDVLRSEDGNALIYRLPVTTNDFDQVRQRLNEAALANARRKQARNAEIDRVLIESQLEARERMH